VEDRDVSRTDSDFSLLGFFGTVAFVYYLSRTQDLEQPSKPPAGEHQLKIPTMSEILTAILVLSGALLILAAAIGVLRLPDVLCRSHAVAKALTLGIFLMLLGLWVDQARNKPRSKSSSPSSFKS
jgi:heme/copper-type cytochrome/quinol oxidase subunit 3